MIYITYNKETGAVDETAYSRIDMIPEGMEYLAISEDEWQNAYGKIKTVEDGEFVYGEPPIMKEELTEFLYQEKCKVAYGGVTVIKDGKEYLFETSQDSITMFNSMAFAIASQPDNFTVTWKVWAEDTPVMLTVTKAEFNAIFAFGMTMINTAFGVEGALNEQAQALTDEQLADADYVMAFKENAVIQLAQVNTVFKLDAE